MDAAEVLMHEAQAHCRHGVIQLFAECIGRAGESAHIHLHSQVCALYVAGRDMFHVWGATNTPFLCASAFRRAVAA